MAPEIDPALLDAARGVLREHGRAGMTIERVAQLAGVSRVTLHRHKIGRDDLLAALAAAAADAYRKALWPPLVGSGDGLERLQAALRAICAVADEHLDILLALQADATATVFHDDAPGPVDTREPFVAPLERLLRDGAADGSLRAVADPQQQAVVLFNAVGQTYLHLRTAHRWPAERATDALLDLLVEGLLVQVP